MAKDKSFGIIPLKQIEGEWQFLVVQPLQGWWGFPKGHADADESPVEAAERELLEETGLRIDQFLYPEPLYELYQFRLQGKLIDKTVAYWIASVKGEIRLQKEEMRDACWLPFDQAVVRLTFDGAKELCRQAHKILVP